MLKKLRYLRSQSYFRSVCTMCTSQADALTHWCLTNNLTDSIWFDKIEAFHLLNKELEPEENVTLEQIMENSEKFPIEFPIETVRCNELLKYVSRESLERYANSVYPLLHEKVLELCAQFILYKRGPAGSKVEQEFYKDMDVPKLIDRLLMKRAILFMNPDDSYILRDATTGIGGWDKIGTDAEQAPLVLKDYLSYEELKISAFLSVSSYTHYLNLGNRTNEGLYFTDRTGIEDHGIIIGLIGPRFEKPNVMEFQEIVHDIRFKMQTNPFFNMYNEVYVSYECLQQKSAATASRFIEYKPGCFFDNVVYAKRIALSFDTLLQEANTRAKEKGTTAYVHVVGIGLGVWKLSNHQNKLFMDACMERLQQFGSRLHAISDVCFSHIRVTGEVMYKNGDVVSVDGHPKGGIKIHVINREPHQKLEGNDEGKLLVVSYAWDSNAHPGNEFWASSLSGSGDPAAACSTQIAELHNAYINPKLRANILRVVTPNGLVTLKDYQEKIKQMRT